MSGFTPNNDGQGPLKVPGFGGIPITFEHYKERFVGAIKWQEWGHLLITVKELAMLNLMNNITDESEWNLKVFKEAEIARWKENASTSPSSLVNDQTWDWCLQELQDKAKYLEEHGHILVLNTGSGVCKSDLAISSALQAALQQGRASLIKALKCQNNNWPIVSDDGIMNLVDPSLFPLIYGKTKVLVDGGSVGLDTFSWRSLIPECRTAPEHPELPQKGYSRGVLEGYCICSTKYQWLPCEVEFTGVPGSTNIRVTSHINNLHPSHQQMYSAIERVISNSIKPWNSILIRSKGETRWRETCPREPMRIRTYGVNWKAEFPEWAQKLPKQSEEPQLSTEQYNESCAWVEEYLKLPESDDKVYWAEGLRRTALAKFAHLFFFEHSDPGTVYSYEYWKAGRTAEAIVGPADQGEWDNTCASDQVVLSYPWLDPYRWKHSPKAEKDKSHEFYSVALQDEFREQGLQVIVGLHSIELTPGKPSFAGEDWHTAGQMNEHIVAVSVYNYDSHNTTEPRISFRQNVKLDGNRYVWDKLGGSEKDEIDGDDEDEYAGWDLEYLEGYTASRRFEMRRP